MRKSDSEGQAGIVKGVLNVVEICRRPLKEGGNVLILAEATVAGGVVRLVEYRWL